MIVIVAAIANNGVIGKDNALPWHLPEDMQHFKALTTGHTVIMGRKTWESLPPRFRPLPNRRNIVVSRNPEFRAPGAEVAGSLQEAIKLGAGATAPEETRRAAPSVSSPPGGRAPQGGACGGDVFVIGGAELYAQALPLAQRLELTEIDAAFDGDAHFPAVDRNIWHEDSRTSGVGASGLNYAFVAYRRA